MSHKQPNPLPPRGYKRPDPPPAPPRRRHAPVEIVIKIPERLRVSLHSAPKGPRKRVSWRDPRFGWA